MKLTTLKCVPLKRILIFWNDFSVRNTSAKLTNKVLKSWNDLQYVNLLFSLISSYIVLDLELILIKFSNATTHYISTNFDKVHL